MGKNIYWKGLIVFIGLIGLLLVLGSVQATEGEFIESIDNPIEADSFVELFVGITNWIAGIIASLATLMIVIGGMQYLFSGGSEEKVKKANKTIFYAVIGLIVVGASWGLLKTLLGILGLE